MEEQTKKKFRNTILFPLLPMVVIIAIAIFFAMSQPSVPSVQTIYNFITSNFNNTLNSSLQTNYNIQNSTFHLVGAGRNNTTVSSFPNDNKTYLYYFGAQFCPFCAAESYVLWSYLSQNKPFPVLDQNFYQAELNIPAIPLSYIMSNDTNSNVVLIGDEVAISAYQQSTENNQTLRNQLLGWVGNMTPQQKYLFYRGIKCPQVYVVRTENNHTAICSAYVGILFIDYNDSNIPKLNTKAYNFRGINLNNVIPLPETINLNLNTLYSCVQAVKKVKL